MTAVGDRPEHLDVGTEQAVREAIDENGPACLLGLDWLCNSHCSFLSFWDVSATRGGRQQRYFVTVREHVTAVDVGPAQDRKDGSKRAVQVGVVATDRLIQVGQRRAVGQLEGEQRRVNQADQATPEANAYTH
jgi:hypothetical protein